MTEDEAFVRTVVDSPGDDLPRLVYADWLDERGDPRGAYLRAEAEWAKAKQTAGFIALRLEGLADGLDPVWVARVSRPPVGVCVEHIGFEKRRPPTNAAALAAIEKRFNLTLPTDYKAFLLNYNTVWSDTAFCGESYPSPLLYVFAVNTDDATPYDGPNVDFASRWQLQQLDLCWRLNEIEKSTSWPQMGSPSRRDFIPVLCLYEEPDGESHWIALGVRGEEVGRVVDVSGGSDEDNDPPFAVSPSFASFLESLVPVDIANPEYPTRRRIFE